MLIASASAKTGLKAREHLFKTAYPGHMELAGHTRGLGTARDKRVTQGNPGYGVGIQILKEFDQHFKHLSWFQKCKVDANKTRAGFLITMALISLSFLPDNRIIQRYPDMLSISWPHTTHTVCIIQPI